MPPKTQGLMPRAHYARGEVRGALPRIPARGTPRGTPLRPPPPFPSAPTFPNGPRRQGSAAPSQRHSPLTAPGRSEDWPLRRERRLMQKPNPSQLAALHGLPLVGPRAAQQISSRQNFMGGYSYECGQTNCAKSTGAVDFDSISRYRPVPPRRRFPAQLA
jgi:hypothetical protein